MYFFFSQKHRIEAEVTEQPIPADNRPESISRHSTENISVPSTEQLDLNEDNFNGSFKTASNEDCTSSTTASTRILDATEETTEQKTEESGLPQTTSPPSRPLSFKENSSSNNVRIEQQRPKTAGSFSKISHPELLDEILSENISKRSPSISSVGPALESTQTESAFSILSETENKNINENDQRKEEVTTKEKSQDEFETQNSTTTIGASSECLPIELGEVDKIDQIQENEPVTPHGRTLKLNRAANYLKSHKGSIKTTSVDIKPADVSAVASGKLEKPKEFLNICINQLESSNWEQTMSGINSFLRLIRYHPDLVDPHIHGLSALLSKHIKNLRSQVSRNSCQATGEFFVTHGRLLEHEAEELATSLLTRTADTNKFLRLDATKALETMCDHMSIHKVTQIITARGAGHQNAIVRAAAARLCIRIVERIGCDKLFQPANRDIRDKIILTGAKMLMEGSLETRNYAKTLFKQMSTNPFYGKTLLEVIPPRTYRNIEKTLKSIKYQQ